MYNSAFLISDGGNKISCTLKLSKLMLWLAYTLLYYNAQNYFILPNCLP